MPCCRLRVLFVCALNKQRSVTAERLYRSNPRLEVRSAGVRADSPRRISEADLNWADVVFVMEREHKSWINERFAGFELPGIDVLDIPDEFEVMDPELQAILRSLLDPEFDHLTSPGAGASTVSLPQAKAGTSLRLNGLNPTPLPVRR